MDVNNDKVKKPLFWRAIKEKYFYDPKDHIKNIFEFVGFDNPFALRSTQEDGFPFCNVCQSIRSPRYREFVESNNPSEKKVEFYGPRY